MLTLHALHITSCYTNHALDQFLEHLIAVGIDKIIRIGGNSSSHILKGKNLRVVAKTESKTSSERRLLGESYGEREIQEITIKSKLGFLGRLQRKDWASIDAYLRRMYPDIHSQFSCVDSEGFVLAGKVEPFELWKTGKGEHLTKLNEPLGILDTILSTANRSVYRLALADRRVLLNHWIERVQRNIIGEASEEIRSHDRHGQTISDVHDEVDERVLATADVVGITTTGLAKRISVLRHIDARVVICEEAGEVLEAHMLSALIPSVQHLIQIGDHQQLRPQINNFDLSLESDQGRQYQLDRSQFERLSVGEPGKAPFPVAQLNVQRRMRPQISSLIRHTLYRRLIDHDTVKNLPDVVGMRKNVFWYDHRNLEDSSSGGDTQRSKSNALEVGMTHALVRHIVRQGAYDSKDIAVLTPYVSQLQKLRAAMDNDFEIVLSERDEETLAKDGFVDDHHASTDSIQRAGLHVQKKAISDLLRVATGTCSL